MIEQGNNEVTDKCFEEFKQTKEAEAFKKSIFDDNFNTRLRKKNKTKLFIPLLNRNGSTTLLNAKNIKSLADILPDSQAILENLLAFDINSKKYGQQYRPLIVEVDDTKWMELEKEIKSKKHRHIFVNKGFDIINDSKQDIPLVTVTKKK